jgi:purine-binding chemotaxis protein CheW
MEGPRETSVQMLVFEVGGRAHALEAASIEEIAAAVTITPIPGAPDSIEGVIDYRGRMIAVLDLRKLLSLPPKALMPSDHLIIARSEDGLVALRVDRAIDLLNARAERVSAISQSPIKSDVVRLDSGLAVLEDISRLLSSEEMRRIAESIGAYRKDPRK